MLVVVETPGVFEGGGAEFAEKGYSSLDFGGGGLWGGGFGGA